MTQVPPLIAAEIAKLLLAAGITQQRLVDEGIGTQTARKLLGKEHGMPSMASADRALSLLKPPRRLWHAKS